MCNLRDLNSNSAELQRSAGYFFFSRVLSAEKKMEKEEKSVTCFFELSLRTSNVFLLSLFSLSRYVMLNDMFFLLSLYEKLLIILFDLVARLRHRSIKISSSLSDSFHFIIT